MFSHGDRVRWSTTGDDGLPLIRYGFVGGVASDSGPVVVMLDGEIGAEPVDLSQLEPVSITTVALHLDGPDLIDDPDLRRGLINLWHAEAESAGLAVDGLRCLGAGQLDAGESWSLAELNSGGRRYVVRALLAPEAPGRVCVRADPLF
jgi:hypothetical protein